MSGASLDLREVKRARKEEIDYIHKMSLYSKVPIQEAYEYTGKAPISVRWIDINKGDSKSPNYRSRLVAREINTSKRDDLFAATPPLEALKTILSITTSGNKGEMVMVNDISRAFFHAPAKRRVYVQLPNEDCNDGDQQFCGRLNFFMYGTRDAAQNWFTEYSRQLINIGFEQAKASPCTFYHRERSIRTYVHGDDYVSTGKLEQLQWLKTQLEKTFQVKTQTLGPGKDDMKQVKILNRVISWDDKRGISYEADPRHVEIISQQLKLGEAKAVSTPGTKEEGRTAENQDEPLNNEQATQYRALVARCNYLSPDRPDISFSVKELARSMANPRQGDWVRLKRLGRYLVGRPRLQQWFTWQPSQYCIHTYTDADWAGCRDTRKSTTGGAITFGKHTLKGWSKTQSLIALSSGESELYATLKASAETLGIISMMQDFGMKVSGEIWGDAQAALGIINRTGLGKTRHIQTGLLWVQQVSADKRLKYGKVLGKVNPADLYTKYVDWATTERHLEKLQYEFTTGRAEEALQLHNISVSIDEYNLMGLWKPWEWIDVITYAVTRKSAKPDERSNPRLCAGEINVLCRHGGERRKQTMPQKQQLQFVGGFPGRPHNTTTTRQPSKFVSTARRQSEELYSITGLHKEMNGVLSMSSNAQGDTQRMMQKLTGFPRGMEQLDVAGRRKEYSVAKWKRPREDEKTCHKANNNHYYPYKRSCVRDTQCAGSYKHISTRQPAIEHHCYTTPLEEDVIDELNHARLQHETRGKCRGRYWLQSATTLVRISNVILYRGRYHLCSRFDSYLGRCNRGGRKDIHSFVMYRV